MTQIDRVIELAAADIGYKESPPNSNRTKYGEWFGMNGQPWCLIAQQYWFDKAGLSALLLPTGGCTTLMNHAKKHGIFHTSAFRRGDLALFNWQGKTDTAEHVGLITDITPGGVRTIEGNTAPGNNSDGGEVMRRERANSLIIGVYRPEYEEEEMDTNELRDTMTALAGTGSAHSPWANEAIEKLLFAGIFRGDGEGNFGWGQLVTREALAQIIYNTLYILRNGGADSYGK